MGGAIAQLVWRQHPDRVAGLVLCSTARNFRGHAARSSSSRCMTAAMHPLSRLRPDPGRAAGRDAAGGAVHGPRRPGAGASAEFRSTSAWSIPEVLGELGRFNSAPWIGEVDVPTAVVVTDGPHHPGAPAAQAGRLDRGRHPLQRPGGHASIVLRCRHLAAACSCEALADVTRRADFDVAEDLTSVSGL